jgi:branched-chain amino acid transport system permease protein
LSTFLQQVINGLSMGSVYGLIAVGYSLVFGVLRMVNFPHSEFFVWGSIAPFITLVQMGLLTSVAVWGVTLGALGVFGPSQHGYPSFFTLQYIHIGAASISNLQLFTMATSALLMLLLSLMTDRTTLGRCIRAVAEDRDVASLVGVNVDRVIDSVFLIGPAVGGLGGLLTAMYTQQTYFALGAIIGMKAWTAAVLGGIGSVKGALAGGLMLGILETIGGGYLPLLTGGRMGSEYQDVFAFVVLILVLLFRPQGLFGEPGRKIR